MTAEITPFPAKPHAAPLDFDALAKDRTAAVRTIRQIDGIYADEFERCANALEHICQTICMTSAALPSLPVGVREEARQSAERLPGIVARVVNLLRPLGTKAAPEEPQPPEAA